MKTIKISLLLLSGLLFLAGCNSANDSTAKIGRDDNAPLSNDIVPPANVETVIDKTNVNQPAVNQVINADQAEYQPYSTDLADKAIGTKPVVILFSSPGCDNCKKLDSNIKENISNFSNAVIFKADFDTEAELVKKFRVTEEDTVVFVDKDGGAYNKKTGANINDIKNFLNLNK